jgi:aspartyl-tRNA(Asn)/glutamyl-tRNA(Gln) amidotransferase subunit B
MATPVQTTPYAVVIGLEVHVQLRTDTKLFCGCRNRFGDPPNTNVCPICLGMPGVLPVMNEKAFRLALRAALALHAEVARFTKWDRKNYYYPDLPKNYQISQYDLPFSRGGYLEIPTPDHGAKRVRIIRVHLEEDAGKLLHAEGGLDDSQVDLNRAGTPLLEIVTQPDLSSPTEARVFLEELRLLLRYLDVSDCNMQEGSLRCDANVNLHIEHNGERIATPIVEVKNMNSFRAVERAMAYEAQRQYEEWLRIGYRLGQVPKETRGWDDERRITVPQRRKEEASDYRYFPEPDLVPVVVNDQLLEKVRAEIGELPAHRRQRFRDQYGLSEYDASALIEQGQAFADYFETVARTVTHPKSASNWMLQEVLRTLNERRWTIQQFPVPPEELADLIRRVEQGQIGSQAARDVFVAMIETGKKPAEIITERGLTIISDEQQLRQLIERLLDANPRVLEDYRRKQGKRKEQVAAFVCGLVMKETRGQADAQLVEGLVRKVLALRTGN